MKEGINKDKRIEKIRKQKDEFIFFSGLEDLKNKIENKGECKRDFLIVMAKGKFSWKEERISGEVSLYELPNGGEQDKIHVATCSSLGRMILEGRIIEKAEFSIYQEREIKRFKIREDPELNIEGFRWSAGGVIPVLTINEKKYVVLILRDENAPNYPLHFAPASGLSQYSNSHDSSSQDSNSSSDPDIIPEIIDPRTVLGREFIEEIRILNKDLNREYRFNFGRQDFWTEYIRKQYEHDLHDRHKKFESFVNRQDYTVSDDLKLEVSFINLGRDKLTVKIEGKPKTISDIKIVIDPISGAVDVMGLVNIEPKCGSGSCINGPEDIRILDYEMKENNKFVHRKIYLVHVDELKNLIEGRSYYAYVYEPVIEKQGSNETIKDVNFCLRRMKERPAMNPPLWESITAAYDKLIGKSGSQTEFGYSYHKSQLVEEI